MAFKIKTLFASKEKLTVLQLTVVKLLFCITMQMHFNFLCICIAKVFRISHTHNNVVQPEVQGSRIPVAHPNANCLVAYALISQLKFWLPTVKILFCICVKYNGIIEYFHIFFSKSKFWRNNFVFKLENTSNLF